MSRAILIATLFVCAAMLVTGNVLATGGERNHSARSAAPMGDNAQQFSSAQHLPSPTRGFTRASEPIGDPTLTHWRAGGRSDKTANRPGAPKR